MAKKKKKTTKRVRAQPPYPLAMVICDAIHQDRATGKRTLLGCFSTIGAPAFPASHPLLAAYVALTDGHGEVPIKLQLVDVDEAEEPLAEAEGKVKFTDPRVVVEIGLHLAGIVFPRPGEYRLQLYGAGELLIERRILLIETVSE